MEYIQTIQKRLSHFTSVLNITYNIKYNEFIFNLNDGDTKFEDSLSVFLKDFLIKYSEKCSNVGMGNTFPIYLIFISSILNKFQEKVKNYSKGLNFDSAEYFEQLKIILLSPFQDENSNLFKTSISSLQTQLEKDLSTKYIHLFLPNEIAFASLIIMKAIFESQDISNPNIFVKSYKFDLSEEQIAEPIKVRNGYLIYTEIDKKLLQMLEKQKFTHLALMTDEIVDLLISDSLKNNANKYFEAILKYVLKFKISIIFSYKRLGDKIMKKFFNNFISVIDQINLEDYNNIKSVFKDHSIILTSNIFFSDYSQHLMSEFSIEIISQGNSAYLLLTVLNKDEFCEKLCQTVIINKFYGLVDVERKGCLLKLIEDFTENIVLILGDKKELIRKKLSFNDYFSILTDKIEQSQFDGNDNSPYVFISDVLKEIDKLLFYKFFNVMEEIREEDKAEIREKVLIMEEYLSEILGIINMLINN